MHNYSDPLPGHLSSGHLSWQSKDSSPVPTLFSNLETCLARHSLQEYQIQLSSTTYMRFPDIVGNLPMNRDTIELLWSPTTTAIPLIYVGIIICGFGHFLKVI